MTLRMVGMAKTLNLRRLIPHPTIFDTVMYLISGIAAAFILLVILYLFTETTPGEFMTQLQNPIVLSALWISISSAIIVCIIAIVLGIPIAYVLARKHFRGRTLIETLLVEVPMSFPPIITGIALLILFSKGPIGNFLVSHGIQVAFTFYALIFAKLYVSLPFLLRPTRIAFESINPNIELAARTLGASPFQVFRKITLPISFRGIVAGLMMVWARAMGEIGASLVFAGGTIQGETMTIPAAIYFMSTQGLLTIAIALSLILMLVTLIVVLVFQRLTAIYTERRT